MVFKFRAFKYRKCAERLVISNPTKYSNNIKVVDIENEVYYLVVERNGKTLNEALGIKYTLPSL